MSLFGRHAREFRRALRDGEWEATKGGVYFPRQRAFLHGHVQVESRGGVLRFPNRIMKGTAFHFTVALTTGLATEFPSGVYIAPWNAAVTPDEAWEDLISENGAASVDDWSLFYRLGELADADYDETARPAWTYADAGAGLIDNSASPAAFTLRTGSTLDVRGFALIPAISNKQAARPIGWNSPVDSGGGGYVNFARVDVTNGNYGVMGSDTVYLPPGTSVGSNAGSGNTDSVNYGKAINLDTLYATGDPNEGPTDLGSLAVVNTWFDPSGDDYYDTGLGHWVDPSGDSINTSNAATPLLAVCAFPGGVQTFVDMDPLNITWGVQLS